ELGGEQRQDSTRDLRIFAQGQFLNRLRRIKARLLAITGQRADQSRLAPVNAQFQHQTVEAVAFGTAIPYSGKSGLERGLDVGKVEPVPTRIFQQEVVDIDRFVTLRAHDVVGF